MAVSAIILAAGRATRFGAGLEGSKLLALLDDKPLIRHVAEAALGSQASVVTVVTGHEAARVGRALDGLDLQIVHNPDYATGMASSLTTGLAASGAGASGALILLGDMPRITSAIVDRLITAFLEDEAADAAVPVYEGRQGNPVLLGRALFAAVRELSGDQGARKLLAEPGRRIIMCPIEDSAIEADVDTREMLEALRELFI